MTIKKLFNNEKIREFVRFCIVGIVATVIHYALYLALIRLLPIEGDLWVNVAYSIGYIVSWCCNFWLTAHFTFKTAVSAKRGVGFAFSHAVNYGLHILLLNLFLYMGTPETWAPIPVYCLVVPINFILVRLVFRKIK